MKKIIMLCSIFTLYILTIVGFGYFYWIEANKNQKEAFLFTNDLLIETKTNEIARTLKISDEGKKSIRKLLLNIENLDDTDIFYEKIVLDENWSGLIDYYWASHNINTFCMNVDHEKIKLELYSLDDVLLNFEILHKNYNYLLNNGIIAKNLNYLDDVSKNEPGFLFFDVNEHLDFLKLDSYKYEQEMVFVGSWKLIASEPVSNKWKNVWLQTSALSIPQFVSSKNQIFFSMSGSDLINFFDHYDIGFFYRSYNNYDPDKKNDLHNIVNLVYDIHLMHFTFPIVHFLYFSTVTITTLGYGDILPNNETIRLAVMTESIWGVVLMGAFASMLFWQPARLRKRTIPSPQKRFTKIKRRKRK